MPRFISSLATRGRPAQLIDTVTKTLANMALPDSMVWIAADADDHETLMAVQDAQRLKWPQGRVGLTMDQREDTVAAKWNRALRLPEPADVYCVSVDDAVHATPGFDAKIVEAANRFPDGIGVVYGHLDNASFPGIMAPTRKFAEKLGHIFPELFPYWFVDHWVDDIARLIGRISFADVRNETNATGTQEMREPAWWATWFDAAYLMRRKIARDIIESPDFQESEWRKEILRTHSPLIEFRSKWINDSVRAQDRELRLMNGSKPPDERYMRIKTKAIEMLPHLLDGYGMERQEAAKYRMMLMLPGQIAAIPQAWTKAG